MADDIEKGSGKFVMEKTWERIQQKTFTKWINSHLRKRKLAIEDIAKDLSDGVTLIQFLEIISNQTFGKYDKKPKIRVQQIQNVGLALEFIKSQRIKLINISAEDIVDHNLKLILGLIWTIIQRFQIEDISEEELSAKEALLLWCQRKTAGYRDVKVDNFTYSWQDGLALCALIHRHRPDLINFDALDKSNKHHNLSLAFDIAEKNFDIPKLLDVEDVADIKPDERSVITYISLWYHYFSSFNKVEVAGRRIGKLVDLTNQIEALKNDFNDRARKLVDWANQTIPALDDRTFDNTLEGAKKKYADFKSYKSNDKPPKTAEKANLETLFNNINLKLKNNKRPPFTAPAGLSPSEIDGLWNKLGTSEDEREKALRDELERQQKLDHLRRKFGLKADKLEKWLAAKDAYLATDESVNSLNEAQTKLKVHDTFDEEYTHSKPRLQAVQDLAAEIAALHPPDAGEINAKADHLANRWNGLAGPQASKRKDLQDKLEKEQKKEELRKEFAKQAKEYNVWNKESVNTVSDHNFGDTLEAVEGFKGQLDSTNSDFASTSANKKANLDKLWDDLQALGVKENRYTPITNKDIEAAHHHLLDEIEKRKAAYQAELERQRLHEEKRKEFAAKAQAFVDHLQARQASIDGLSGEPDELINSIKSNYQEGKPETESLASLSALQEELSSLGIRDNKYTTFNLPILQARNTRLANHVRNLIASLNDEKELKAEYNNRATALVGWANQQLPTLKELHFDNTLAGARNHHTEWTKYQTTSKATQDNEKINVNALFNKISSLLAANKRPAFNPPSGLDPASIESVWATLAAEEKKREDAINAELARQEKLASLVKRFNSDAEDLEAWAAEKEAYLTAKEDVDTLDAARMKAKFLEVFKAQFAGKGPALAELKALAAEINSLNYHDVATVNSRLSNVEATWQRFDQLASAKGASLAAALEEQQQREDLRVSFANHAKDFARYVREATESVSDYNFGFTLEEVQAHSSNLDKNDAEVNDKANSLKSAVDSASAQLASRGVTDNKHTTLTQADVDNLRASLADAVNKRRAAYNDELHRQQVNEAKRKEFAEKASSFVSWVDSQKNTLSSLQGTPEERIAATQSLHQGGAPGSSKIQELGASDNELKSLGVYDNKHTPYSFAVLKFRNAQFDNSVSNFISDLNEEKELNARAAAQQAEYEHKLKLENLRIELSKNVQELNAFLDGANEILTDPIRVDSVEGINSLQQNFDGVQAQVPTQTAKFNSLGGLSSSLSAEGVAAPIDEITSKWNSFLAESEARKTALAEESARQHTNEANRVDFANQANAFNNFVQEKTNAINNLSGELEDQLKTIQTHKPAIAAGREQLASIGAVNHKLDEAGVTSNKHTTLTYPFLQAAYEGLAKAANDRETVIQKEIIQARNKGVTAEQLAEFKEAFDHFDKDKTGQLTRLQFKSSLQSLGEDPTDAELDRLLSAHANASGNIPFEAFAQIMSQRAADSDNKDQILDAFKIIAGDKDFILEADLRKVLPGEKVEYLVKNMPLYQGQAGSYDYRAWAASTFGQ